VSRLRPETRGSVIAFLREFEGTQVTEQRAGAAPASTRREFEACKCPNNAPGQRLRWLRENFDLGTDLGLEKER
jgi:hypothetical protein